MRHRIYSVLRIFFLIVGGLFALMGIVTFALFMVLRPPGDHSDALRGGLVYLVIAGVCFFAAWRLKLRKVKSRGFEVVSKTGSDTGAS